MRKEKQLIKVYIVEAYIDGFNMTCGFTDEDSAQAYAWEMHEKCANHLELIEDYIYE